MRPKFTSGVSLLTQNLPAGSGRPLCRVRLRSCLGSSDASCLPRNAAAGSQISLCRPSRVSWFRNHRMPSGCRLRSKGQIKPSECFPLSHSFRHQK